MDKDTVTTLKWLSPILILLLLIAAFLTTCHPMIGLFPESSFMLHEVSRLPKWFDASSKYDRKDLNVRIYYFGSLYGTTFKAVLLGPGPEYKKLDSELGTHRWHPDTLREKEARGNMSFKPQYIIAKINGVEEVIEHRENGPIFHVSDNQLLLESKR